MNITVKFTKIGNKVKYRLPFRIFCKEMKKELPRTATLDKVDCLLKTWLGDVDKVFKDTSVVFKKVYLGQIYDKCDSPRNFIK